MSLHFTVYIVRETHHFKQLYWVLLLWDTNALTTLIRLMNIISLESVIYSWLLHKSWGGHFYRRAQAGCSSCTSGDETHCLPRHVNIVHVCRYQEQMKKNRIVSQVNIVTAADYRSWEAGSDHVTVLLTQSFSYTGRRGRHRAQGWGERGWGQKNRFHPASLFTRGQTFPPLNSIFFFQRDQRGGSRRKHQMWRCHLRKNIPWEQTEKVLVVCSPVIVPHVIKVPSLCFLRPLTNWYHWMWLHFQLYY